jgi:hypothetical protein
MLSPIVLKKYFGTVSNTVKIFAAVVAFEAKTINVLNFLAWLTHLHMQVWFV